MNINIRSQKLGQSAAAAALAIFSVSAEMTTARAASVCDGDDVWINRLTQTIPPAVLKGTAPGIAADQVARRTLERMIEGKEDCNRLAKAQCPGGYFIFNGQLHCDK